MIILRDKLFGRENHAKLPEEKRFVADPELVRRFGECQIEISAANKFGNDKNKLGPIDKARVNQFKSEIKKGYIYEDGPTGGDTEYLDFPGENSHLMSKKINGSDRFNYRVYPPTIEEDENGFPIYRQKIVLESCLGHGRNGARNYSTIN